MDREHSLLFVSALSAQANPLMDALSRRHRCVGQTPRSFGDIRGSAASQWVGVVIDTDLNDAQTIEQIKRGMRHFDRNATFVVVIVDPYGPVDMKLAMILRADRVIPRIVINDAHAHAQVSPQLLSVLEVARTDYIRNGLEAIEWLIAKFTQPKTLSLALMAGESALDSVFHLAKTRESISMQQMQQHNEAVLSGVDEHGLQKWLDTVRRHHNVTYRHSLAVAGIAGTFARTLKFSRRDTERLMLAALLHDIGKAEVPVDILEKGGVLTDREQEIMRRHPVRGRQMVESQKGLDQAILNVISDHHELLDGSGYPNGLKGDQIGDMTRLMTICDCFANLISRKPPLLPMSNRQAFEMLSSKTAELDQALVGAFSAVVTQLDREERYEIALAS